MIKSKILRKLFFFAFCRAASGHYITISLLLLELHENLISLKIPTMCFYILYRELVISNHDIDYVAGLKSYTNANYYLDTISYP